jgi:hypothetical protein
MLNSIILTRPVIAPFIAPDMPNVLPIPSVPENPFPRTISKMTLSTTRKGQWYVGYPLWRAPETYLAVRSFLIASQYTPEVALVDYYVKATRSFL